METVIFHFLSLRKFVGLCVQRSMVKMITNNPMEVFMDYLRTPIATQHNGSRMLDNVIKYEDPPRSKLLPGVFLNCCFESSS
jgi:hypothetical protein